jgi:hypothetical protein
LSWVRSFFDVWQEAYLALRENVELPEKCSFSDQTCNKKEGEIFFPGFEN